MLDERFRRCESDAWTRRLFTGCRWAEGPAYFLAGRYLVFSDIPNDRLLRFDELTGTVGEFRAPAGVRQRRPQTQRPVHRRHQLGVQPAPQHHRGPLPGRRHPALTVTPARPGAAGTWARYVIGT